MENGQTESVDHRRGRGGARRRRRRQETATSAASHESASNHSPSSTVTSSLTPAASNTICQFFLESRCQFGVRCLNIHLDITDADADILKRAVGSSRSSSSRNGTESSHSTTGSDSMDGNFLERWIDSTREEESFSLDETEAPPVAVEICESPWVERAGTSLPIRTAAAAEMMSSTLVHVGITSENLSAGSERINSEISSDLRQVAEAGAFPVVALSTGSTEPVSPPLASADSGHNRGRRFYLVAGAFTALLVGLVVRAISKGAEKRR